MSIVEEWEGGPTRKGLEPLIPPDFCGNFDYIGLESLNTGLPFSLGNCGEAKCTRITQ